jgi:hypothetical protein
MANLFILKNTRRQAAVKIVGTGLANVTYTDIKYSDQTIPLTSTGNLSWTITDIAYDAGTVSNITRGGNVVFSMNAGQGLYNLSKDIGVVLNEQANANVQVNMGAVPGTLIIQFSKETGFNDPDRQILQPKDR